MADFLPLLDWWEAGGRDLPWRRTRDPWAVLVSELMLQQTQVARVETRWRPFLDRFPDPAACAGAGAGAVVEAWRGLGYNRRAVNLHRCAVEVVARHGGRLPDDLDALLALPGIGAYTARAVLVFAFGRDLGLVDTNAGRFLARAGSGAPLRGRAAQALADSLVPAGRGWDWGQAVFDLGALVCTRRDPRCHRCPVAGACAWNGAGRPEPDPVVGSAGISGRQARFEGSDRQARGRLVDALRRGPVPPASLAEAAGLAGDGDRAERLADGLVRDGLAVRDHCHLRLP
ncbi:MAG: A/G-specific adenine glycosylase [Acidimicrobiia bacterium]